MIFKEGKLSKWHLLMVIGIAFIILVTRRPDVINNPQLWAEDGKAFLEPVWNNGFINSLLTSRDGYFQSLPKITMGFASIFGIANVALISTIAAILIRCLFVAFIMTSRFSYVDLRLRIAFCIYFLVQPNVQEAFINITNAHTYLAIYLLAIILAKDNNSKIWKAHDLLVLVLSGISGPFIALLAPSLAIKRFYERGSLVNMIKKINFFDVIFAVCLLTQAGSVIFGDYARTPAKLGATLPLFFDIVSYKIILGTFFDLKYVSWAIEKYIFNVVMVLLFTIPATYFFFKMDWRYKAAFTYVFFTLLVSLYKPVINHQDDQWPLFLIPIVGCRYFILSGMGIFCLSLIIIKKVAVKPYFIISIFSLALVPSMVLTYRMPKMENVGFNSDIEKFKNALPGEKILIHTNPPGWEMELIKK